jgi:hypothetical protein
MFRNAKLVAPLVLGLAGLILQARPASAAEPWQITLRAEETAPGWFKIRAWGKNVSGHDLEDCSCELTVSGNAEIQPNSQGTIYLGDAANGATLYFEFDVYSAPEGEPFTYTVEFNGYIYHDKE